MANEQKSLITAGYKLYKYERFKELLEDNKNLNKFLHKTLNKTLNRTLNKTLHKTLNTPNNTLNKTINTTIPPGERLTKRLTTPWE